MIAAPPPRAISRSGGFTLVVTLTVLAAVTLLAVGIFAVATGEKRISAAFDGVEQADLAVQAGLAKAATLLDEVTKQDDAVIFSKPLEDEQGRPREYLMAARYDTATDKWRYYPLMSGARSPLLPSYEVLPSSKLVMDLDG